MGYIKEPKGVDFVIASEPLTDDDRREISEFIRRYKLKETKKKVYVDKNGLRKTFKSVQP